MTVADAPFDLVEAKLAAPRTRPGSVPKTGVIARLRGSRQPFATVIAPAGYGKTTLLARWAEMDPRPFAWVALDGRDDDGIVFLRYIAAAIHRVEPLAPAVFDPGLQLLHYEVNEGDEGAELTAHLLRDGAAITITGSGNGPIAAFVDALERHLGLAVDVVDYAEHALGAGHEASAAAFVELTDGARDVRWGVGIDQSILSASLKAVVSAINHQAAPTSDRAVTASRA